jgi:hypothetical protein
MRTAESTGPKLSEQIMVRMEPAVLDRLRAHAEDGERTVAQVCRLAIKRYLDTAL